MKLKTICAFAVLLILCVSTVGTVSATENTDDKTIHVSGNGKVTTAPDKAIISIAVVTENEDVKKAQQENAVKMDQAINALKALGLTSDNLKTTGYNIHSYTPDDPKDKGIWNNQKKIYRVTNTLEITLTDINKTGDVIDAAVQNEANKVNSVYFTLSDEKENELRSKALAAAVAQAKNDADTVVNALNMKITGVKEVNVGSSYIPMRYMDNAFQEKAMGGFPAPTPIEPDTVDVTASVSITYLIN